MSAQAATTKGERAIAAAGPADGSGAMFDRIAGRYDLLNRLLSLGLDQSWRGAAIAALEAKPGALLLDVATGTGEVALALLRRHPGVTVVGLDPAPRMLERARRKAERVAASGRLGLVPGIAESLPFADGAFSGAIVAFGIRNTRDRLQALREMRRVVAPGGRVVVLELCAPTGRGPLARAAAFHARHLVPRLGALLSLAPPYRYLARSMAAFPPAPEFEALLERAGLLVVSERPLSFGVAHLFVAVAARGQASGGAR